MCSDIKLDFVAPLYYLYFPRTLAQYQFQAFRISCNMQGGNYWGFAYFDMYT